MNDAAFAAPAGDGEGKNRRYRCRQY